MGRLQRNRPAPHTIMGGAVRAGVGVGGRPRQGRGAGWGVARPWRGLGQVGGVRGGALVPAPHCNRNLGPPNSYFGGGGGAGVGRGPPVVVSGGLGAGPVGGPPAVGPIGCWGGPRRGLGARHELGCQHPRPSPIHRPNKHDTWSMCGACLANRNYSPKS